MTFRPPLITRQEPVKRAPEFQQSNLLETTLVSKDALPFRQQDWPNPRGPEFPVILRTWIDTYKLNLIGKDALPNRQQDWPNPRGPAFSIDLRTWTDSYKLALIGKDLLPKNQSDWPNPRGPQRLADYTWVDSYKQELIGQDRLPENQSDWQNPRGPQRLPDYTWMANLLESTLGQTPLPPLIPFDWPNPVTRASVFDTTPPNLLESTLSLTPAPPTPTPSAPAGGDDVPRRRKSPHKGFDLEAWKARQQDFEGTIRQAYDELMRGPHAEEVRDIVAPHLETDPDVQRDIDWQALFADYRAISDMIQIHEAQMMEEEAIVSLLIH